MRSRHDARYRRLVVALVLLAFALRAGHLDGQGLWSDESISLERSTQSMAAMIAGMPVEHAPLYFVLLNLWLRVAGTSDFALRFPSLWFGVLAAPLIAALGREMFAKAAPTPRHPPPKRLGEGEKASGMALNARNRPWNVGRDVGLLAAFLLAINPLHVWHAQDARMYTLATALGLGALVAVVDAVRTGSRRAWAAYAILAALTLYTHYYGGLIVVIAAVYSGMATVRNSARRGKPDHPIEAPPPPAVLGEGAGGWGPPSRPFLLAHAAVAILFLPWLPRALGILAFTGWRDPLDPTTVPAVLAARFFLGPSVPADEGARIALGCVALAVLGIAATVFDLRRGRRHEPQGPGERRPTSPGSGGWLLVVGTGLLFASIAGILKWKGDLHERYFLPATPFLYLAVARGISALRSPRIPGLWLAAVAFVAMTSAWSLRHHYFDVAHSKPDYREFTQHILDVGEHEDALFLLGPGRFLTARYGGDDLPRIYNLLSTKNSALSPAEVESLLAEVARERRRIWLAVEGRDPGAVKAWLDAHGYLVEGGWRVGLMLFYYAFPAADPPPRDAARVEPALVDDRLTYGLAPPRPVTGGIAHVGLTWRTRRADLPPDPQVSLRLIDAWGKTRATWDGELVAGGDGGGIDDADPGARVFSVRAGLRVPADAVPGRHRLVAIIYRRDDLAPLVEAELGDVVVVAAEVAAPGARWRRPIASAASTCHVDNVEEASR